MIMLTVHYDDTGGVNFVYADGLKFAHPLSHLGKSKKVRKLVLHEILYIRILSHLCKLLITSLLIRVISIKGIPL